MDWQQLASAGIAIIAAALLVGSAVRKRLRGGKAECAGGCGCAAGKKTGPAEHLRA